MLWPVTVTRRVVDMAGLIRTAARKHTSIVAAVPEQNVDAGTRYLRVLLDRYHSYRNGMTRAIAAYNAGPGVVDRYRGVPPYRETRGYVARVLAYMRVFEKERA